MVQTPTKASTKSLPNDPQRQGNIWHRYEQLENATKSLSNVNQQLVEERARHKKVSLSSRSHRAWDRAMFPHQTTLRTRGWIHLELAQ